jgi:D-alanyl-D-alanine carboxypeptidase
VFLPLKLLALLWLSLNSSTRSKPTAPLASCEPALLASDLLVLVNKSERHSLAKHWRPPDLVRIPRIHMKRGHRGKLRKDARTALVQMLKAAKEDGLRIRVLSGYRSFHTQKRIFHNKERKHGSRHARRVSARPGHSQHQLGTTVDLVARRFDWKLSQRFARAREGRWLAAHAHEYGFALSYPRGKEELTGYIHEPWHYRYLGVEAASEMDTLQISMERYLQSCQRCDSEHSCRVAALDT